MTRTNKSNTAEGVPADAAYIQRPSDPKGYKLLRKEQVDHATVRFTVIGKRGEIRDIDVYSSDGVWWW